MDQELATTVLQNIADLFITPEVERRRSRGNLTGEVGLWAAQIILNVDAPPVVLLNSEIRGVFRARARADGPPLAIGDTPTLAELGAIEGVELETADANAAHFTVLFHENGFFLQFDLRYNATRIAQILVLAAEYLATAESAFGSGYLRPTLANLFAASELLAKAVLMTHPDTRLLTERSHSFVKVELNRYGKRGNIDDRFVSLHNRLFDLRNDARYSTEDVNVTMPQVRGWLDVARQMLDEVEERRPRRAAV